METPSGATTETTTAPPAGGATSENPGTESPPVANNSGEKTRIDELTGNWRETQRDRDYWRELALKNGASAQQPRGNESNGGNGDAADEGDDEDVKTLKDFNYDEKKYTKYILGLARKTASSETERLRGEIKGERTESEKRAVVGEFQEKAVSWAKAQKLENVELMFKSPAEGGPAVSDTMAEAIMTSAHGPEILNYLARNASESRKIHAMSPAQQGREIGRLEAKFAAAPTPPPGGKAPPPHETVKGAGDPGLKPDPAKQSDSEWLASRQRSERARAAARK